MIGLSASRRRRAMTRGWHLLLLLGATALQLGTGCVASASASAPWWQLSGETAPTHLEPGGQGEVIVGASNLGDAPINGGTTPVVLTDKLPAGVVVTGIEQIIINGVQTQCTPGAVVTCKFAGVLNPYERLAIPIKVTVETGVAGALMQEASVEGGGGTKVSTHLPLDVSSVPTPFGVSAYELGTFDESGAPATQAGSNPFQLTTTLVLNQTAQRQPVALPKDLSFNLPPGLIGNADATEQCTMSEFSSLVDETNLCPVGSVVGVATITANEPKYSHVFPRTVPVFNLVPSQGEPARFGFEVIGKVPIVIDTSVRSGESYAVVATVKDATQTAGLLFSQVTLWGVPGDPRHDNARGWECVAGGMFHNQVGKPCPATTELPQRPFLRLPTSCAADPSVEPVSSSVEADSWAEPGAFLGAEYAWLDAGGGRLGFSGCSALSFAPQIGASAEQTSAASPSGLSVSVRIPQASWSESGGLSEADVQDSSVALPAGVELSPSAANGLQACAAAQIGFTGFSSSGMAEFAAGAPSCPDASKIGVVHVRTPLLAHELEGVAYLAAQNANPFGSLVALYIYAEDPVSGVWVKLAGEGHLNEATGQVTTTFDDTPQVPFEELRLDLFGGPRASVSTPVSCASYSLEGSFRAWSGAEADGVLSPPEDFQVSSGAGGGPCPSGVPFAPGFDAQSAITQAGGFTPFTVDIARPDGDQALTGVSVHLPPGIAAVLASVTPCAEPPAGGEWSCGPDSLVGHSLAWSGLGSEPVTLPGDVYLTSGYDGAPFGLLVRTHAAAGPFDLGYVNVRSRINVNPTDASVTITTDPGPHGDSLPVRIKGIPAQLKYLRIAVDRPNFEFNPTNCNPMNITGRLSGDRGATAPASSPFQVGGCEGLPFAPKLTASVVGKGSRVDGTAFTVRLESAGLGQANIHKVLLQLPKALPSRLETLKKACLAATFEANPATCSPESVIGTATIHTPVLKGPLSGPAYLVSHGNAAFPDVEFVLQGEGITLVVDGQTDIKNNVTYSKFETAPDAPFTTFETSLPAGPKSVLAIYNTANSREPYSACGTNLLMPTTIISQSNKLIETETPITTTGCGAVKSSKTKKLSLHQRYTKALRTCRTRYRHDKHRRQTCDRRVHATYMAKAVTACHHKHNRKQRHTCETTAHRQYAAKTS